MPLSHHRGFHAYLGGPDLGKNIAPAGEGLTAAEGRAIKDILKDLPWVDPVAVYLIAGWMFAAPLCGLLRWRSHIWLTGPHGTGKSTILQRIVLPLLNGFCRAFEGGSTSAGVRQDLRSDALAIVYDEAEADKNSGKSNVRSVMEQVLDLARVSSSSSGGRVVKGTGTQTGALSYQLHSMFMFSSIVTDIGNAADDSRITKLELTRSRRTDADDVFVQLMRSIEQTITPEFCRRFVRRCIDQAPYIRANVDTFTTVLVSTLPNSSDEDQLDTLVAG